jgi:hypothetical protein
MLRVPNPGSDIDSFIGIYQELFEALRERASFDLDDMSRVLVERNLATSSGYMGEEALLRSFNRDRSRDPIYNQAKMYSELYKVLGWLHPTPESALRFRFTYLGAHVAAARRDPAAMFRECIVGMAYPNAVLNVRGNHVLRPFATTLRTMAELDGLLHRDEMIVGPLSLGDDRDQGEFDAMIAELESLRRDSSHLGAKLSEVSQQRGISTTTMRNYTRFPIAVIKWLGWARSERRRDYCGKSTPFLVLTSKGEQEIRTIASCQDVRATDVRDAGEEAKAAIVRASFYQMLGRAGFDVETVQGQIASDLAIAQPFLKDTTRPLLFSPFQELDPQYLAEQFPKVSGVKVSEPSRLRATDISLGQPQIVSEVSLLGSPERAGVQADRRLVSLFEDAAARVGDDPRRVADYIAATQQDLNQDQFYPLVAQLFSALGYQCEYSRPGVNSQRWDAMIVDPKHSIPIEIKSPGEEEYLSVKAVRQALENKVILLSRKSFATEPSTTSLVVGFNPPNDRSQVASLVADIREAFGIVIGVIDLRSLLFLAAARVLHGKSHNVDDLRTLHGIIKVSDTHTETT